MPLGRGHHFSKENDTDAQSVQDIWKGPPKQVQGRGRFSQTNHRFRQNNDTMQEISYNVLDTKKTGLSSQLKLWILSSTLWISSTHLITANSSTNRTETSPKYRKKVVQTNCTLKQRLFEFVPVNNRLASHADILKGYHASLFFGRLLLFKETNQHWLIVKRKANHML